MITISFLASLEELRAGVYVGNYSARTREMVREQVGAWSESGDAAMILQAPADQGYEFKTAGTNPRMPMDFDGVKLVRFYPERQF
ncbi:type I-E CRISPR-associated endoribonuclease Cas2 [Roseibium sp. RKSG952]|nr:type I-E CRISPR-associated endoribonuclease Cas2 [Roseibium sp. RKSG952]